MNKMSKEDYRRCITKMINEIGNEDMLRQLFFITQVYRTRMEDMLRENNTNTTRQNVAEFWTKREREVQTHE